MTYSHQDGARDRQSERAAIFVDYENLFRTLGRAVENGASPAVLISEMIEALQRSLLEDRKTQSAVTRAYADFASLDHPGEPVQRSLYLQGVEPHFVPGTHAADAVEIQLCVDAMDLLHHRADIATFVLLTGRRIYLPLIRMFRRYGRNVLVVGLDEPAALEEIPHLEEGWFFPARDLLSASTRETVGRRGDRQPFQGDFEEIEDPILIRTLEIIDEYFGQYEEVYLTPLLRKLSELLDERRHDPKNLISDLEDRGAVRLEKRQGFPHDYTVLILEEHHPSVQRVVAEMRHFESYDLDGAHDGHTDTHDAEPGGSYRQNGETTYPADQLDGEFGRESDGEFDGDLPDVDDFEEADPRGSTA